MSHVTINITSANCVCDSPYLTAKTVDMIPQAVIRQITQAMAIMEANNRNIVVNINLCFHNEL